MPRKKRGKKIDLKPPTKIVNPPLGGWLIVFLYCLFLFAVYLIFYGLSSIFFAFNEQGHSQFIYVFLGLVIFTFAEYVVYTAVMIIKKKPHAVSLARNTLLGAMVFFVSQLVNYSKVMGLIGIPQGFGFLNLVIASLFFAYFHYSGRVLTTFPVDKRKKYVRDDIIIGILMVLFITLLVIF